MVQKKNPCTSQFLFLINFLGKKIAKLQNFATQEKKEKKKEKRKSVKPVGIRIRFLLKNNNNNNNDWN